MYLPVKIMHEVLSATTKVPIYPTELLFPSAYAIDDISKTKRNEISAWRYDQFVCFDEKEKSNLEVCGYNAELLITKT